MFKKKGEINTLITISFLFFLGASALFSSLMLKRKQSISSKAAVSSNCSECPWPGIKKSDGSCEYGLYDVGVENPYFVDKGHHPDYCFQYDGCVEVNYSENERNPLGGYGVCRFSNAIVCRRYDYQGGCGGMCNWECCAGGGKMKVSGADYDAGLLVNNPDLCQITGGESDHTEEGSNNQGRSSQQGDSNNNNLPTNPPPTYTPIPPLLPTLIKIPTLTPINTLIPTLTSTPIPISTLTPTPTPTSIFSVCHKSQCPPPHQNVILRPWRYCQNPSGDICTSEFYYFENKDDCESKKNHINLLNWCEKQKRLMKFTVNVSINNQLAFNYNPEKNVYIIVGYKQSSIGRFTEVMKWNITERPVPFKILKTGEIYMSLNSEEVQFFVAYFYYSLKSSAELVIKESNRIFVNDQNQFDGNNNLIFEIQIN